MHGITRLSQDTGEGNSGNKKSGKRKDTTACAPNQTPHGHHGRKLESSIALLEPHLISEGRGCITYTFLSSLYPDGVESPTFTTVKALAISLPSGGMVYVTVNGQLADQGMVDTSMAPMSARDYMFRYEGLHGQLRKDNAYLVELAAAIERHAKRRHPSSMAQAPIPVGA